MIAFPLHLLGLSLALLWLRVRSHYRLGVLFGLWWIGLALCRIVPGILTGALINGTDPARDEWVGRFIALTAWAGAIVLLRALLGLVLWERPRNRRFWIWGGIWAISMLLGGIYPRAMMVFLLPALPFLISFRWATKLGTVGTLLVSLSCLLSIGSCLVTISGIPSPTRGMFAGLDWLAAQTWGIAAIYAFLALPATLRRIHLTIRRIRIRLVGSHLLAGLVPLALAALFLFLAGALFLSTYRSAVGTRLLVEASKKAEKGLALSLADTGKLPETPFGPDAAGQIVLVRDENGTTCVFGGPLHFTADSLLARNKSSGTVPFFWDGQTLFLRARIDTLRDGRILRVEALAPVDSLRMEHISRLVGVPVRVNPHIVIEHVEGGGVQVTSRDDSDPELVSDASRSIGPHGEGKWALPGGATAACLRETEEGWATIPIVISSSASLGEEILSLFSITGENPTAIIVLVILAFIAALILAAIWITAAQVYDMSRSITSSVQALTHATGALREGKLDHRILIKGNDELWSVASSFNEMATGLQRMRAIEQEAQRMEEELRLAREIQTRLLPAEPPQLDGLELAGLSLPAREVGGDYFDYLVLEDGRVAITVADVSGKGTPAALLMSAYRASLRSQDLAMLGPAGVLKRVNRFVHSSVDPGTFITAFLGMLDPATGELRYASAGHDAPFVLQPDGTLDELTSGGLILGMHPQFPYEESSANLASGAVLVVYTDGVTEAQDPAGRFFESQRLAETLKASVGLPCAEIQRRVIDEIQAFCASGPQSDDITLLLARRR